MKRWNKTPRHKLLMPCKPFLCYIWHIWSQYLNIVMFHESRVAYKYPAPLPSGIRWICGNATCNAFKRKPFDVSRCSHPVIFLITLHFNCAISYSVQQFVKALLRKYSDENTLFLEEKCSDSLDFFYSYAKNWS